jgi:hypothetical protein
MTLAGGAELEVDWPGGGFEGREREYSLSI